jgi:hypothetical protein
MTSLKKLKSFTFVVALLSSATLHAQIEISQLIMKGQNAAGVGGFLHFGFEVPKGDEVSGELGFSLFAPGQSHLYFIPILAGYRHFFDHSRTRFYIEPFAGYTFGATDIPEYDAGGNPIYNSDGSQKDEAPDGPTAGLGFGYIIPSAKAPVNFGLRFEHIFTSGVAAPSLLSFRVSWSVLTGRRLEQQ